MRRGLRAAQRAGASARHDVSGLRDEATAAAAGELAVEGARPLSKNGYKVPLTQGVVKQALLALA